MCLIAHLCLSKGVCWQVAVIIDDKKVHCNFITFTWNYYMPIPVIGTFQSVYYISQWYMCKIQEEI